VPKKNIAEEEKSSWKYLGKNVGRKEEKMPQAKKDFFSKEKDIRKPGTRVEGALTLMLRGVNACCDHRVMVNTFTSEGRRCLKVYTLLTFYSFSCLMC
jgi:hypothetical protein